MKPQHLSSDALAIHECKRMVREKFRQAFQAMVDDNINKSSSAEKRVFYGKKVKRSNRRVKA